MPFVSAKQRAFMHQNHPEIAAKWEAETPEGADLPERAERPKKRKRAQSPKMIGPAARRRW